MINLTPKGFSNGQFVDRYFLRDKLYAEDAITMKGVAILNEFPAADVVEVRHGLWINERQEGLSSFSAECSLCGKRILAYFHYFYCPNCGAKMDGGRDE